MEYNEIAKWETELSVRFNGCGKVALVDDQAQEVVAVFDLDETDESEAYMEIAQYLTDSAS